MPTEPTRQREREMLERSARYVIGMDEVGRGAIAGPVCVGAAVVSTSTGDFPLGLRDSKLLGATRRERLAPQCREWVDAWALGWATAAEVDHLGIITALRLAGVRALGVLDATSVTGTKSSARQACGHDAKGAAGNMCEPEGSAWLNGAVVLLDGKHDWLSPALAHGVTSLPISVPVVTQVRADADCAVVAAASVLAKCARDALMVAAAALHPNYGWESNKGYGSKAHFAALAEHGPCVEHRLSWLKGHTAGGAA